MKFTKGRRPNGFSNRPETTVVKVISFSRGDIIVMGHSRHLQPPTGEVGRLETAIAEGKSISEGDCYLVKVPSPSIIRIRGPYFRIRIDPTAAHPLKIGMAPGTPPPPPRPKGKP